MKLIVGLGNPGKKYKNNRHNLGFMVIDALAEDFKEKLKHCKRTNSKRTKVKIRNKEIMLAKPQTFINNSGLAVKKIINYYKIKPQDVWIIFDDIDLPLGKIRIRYQGSSGGHKGLASIIENLKTDHFNRLRVGIGSNREKNIPAEKYVLQNFKKNEIKTINQTIKEVVEILKKEI
ncbi:MAG: aminoacyl-tRNA hydrolase [Patescibacteria group bacterium]|nr:aminoacyl-tRNA hydrolase [Patescibacteria group bacterium]